MYIINTFNFKQLIPATLKTLSVYLLFLSCVTMRCNMKQSITIHAVLRMYMFLKCVVSFFTLQV